MEAARKATKTLLEKRHWLLPILTSVGASLLRGDSAKRGFWSWKRWRTQRRFFNEHGQVEDIFRNIEYNYAEWALALGGNHRMLDVGTGHTVFAGYMAGKTGCPLVAIDYDRYCEVFQRGFMDRLGHKDFELVFADATKSELPAESFDRILAVSVIEHFPGCGDSDFMAEAARLLKPGGRVVITVPFSNVFQENEQVTHYHGFERRYDEKALHDRLVKPSGLRLRNMYFMNQRVDSWTGKRLVAKYGTLDNYFGKWYERRDNQSYSRFSVFVTRSLLDIGDKPDATCCGAMLTVEKA